MAISLKLTFASFSLHTYDWFMFQFVLSTRCLRLVWAWTPYEKVCTMQIALRFWYLETSSRTLLYDFLSVYCYFIVSRSTFGISDVINQIPLQRLQLFPLLSILEDWSALHKSISCEGEDLCQYPWFFAYATLVLLRNIYQLVNSFRSPRTGEFDVFSMLYSWSWMNWLVLLQRLRFYRN